MKNLKLHLVKWITRKYVVEQSRVNECYRTKGNDDSSKYSISTHCGGWLSADGLVRHDRIGNEKPVISDSDLNRK